MSEQPAQNNAGCSASVQMPGTLHIDLPHADLDDVCLTIGVGFIQLTASHWDLISVGVTSYELITLVGNLCMDIVQNLAEAILDVVMPQVYKYMRTYGTFSPSVLGLTEDRIQTYLGDSIEQALAESMMMKVQDMPDTQVFSQLLRRHISRTVDSVLASTTQTPMPNLKNPMFYVSGCHTSVSDLKSTAFEFINIVTKSSQLAKTTKKQKDKLPPQVFCPFNTTKTLRRLVRTYITRNVNVLRKRAEKPYFPITSNNHRDLIFRVGRNIQMLTIEESESPIPDNQIMVTATGLNQPPEIDFEKMDSIRDITDVLIETFLKSNQSKEALELEDRVKLKKITQRLFDVVMMGRDYPITILPAGTRLCNTVVYRELARGTYTNSGLVAHALYMRTEEVIYRCAVQILLWSALLTPVDSDDPYSTDDESPLFEYGHVVEGGDNEPSLLSSGSSFFSYNTHSTYNISLPEGMVLTPQGPSHNNDDDDNHPTAKKRTCSFLKKCRELCCSKTSPITPVTSQLSDKESSHLSTDETGQTEQHQSPVIRRIAAAARSMCSSIRKKFSCFGRALRGPFSASVSPEEERTPTPTGGAETNDNWGGGDQHQLEERRRRRRRREEEW